MQPGTFEVSQVAHKKGENLLWENDGPWSILRMTGFWPLRKGSVRGQQYVTLLSCRNSRQGHLIHLAGKNISKERAMI